MASGSAAARGALKRAHIRGTADQDPSRPSPSTRAAAPLASVSAHAPLFAPIREAVPRTTLSVYRFVDAVGLHHTVTNYGPSILGDPNEIDDVIDAVQPPATTTQRRPPSPARAGPAPSPTQPLVARPSEWDQYLDPVPVAPAASHPVVTQGIPPASPAPDA